MSKEVTFDDFMALFSIAVEKHKNTNEPIPELNQRKIGKIQGCLKSPFQSFGGHELYPDVYDKAAKLFYEINKGHNLANGNKRMAYIVTEYFLFKNNISLEISDNEIYELSVNVAKSVSDDKDKIVNYIKTTIQKNTKMTKKDFEIKLAAAKSNKALNDKQREQIVSMYAKKIAEFEADEKKVAPTKKASPAKAAPKKETGYDGTYSDYEGEVFEELEEQGELTRSDAQGMAMPYETFIEEQMEAGKTPKQTAIAILNKSTVKESKSSPKKESKKAEKESLLEYENGVVSEIVRVNECSKAQALEMIDDSAAVALIKKGYKEDWTCVLTAREVIKSDKNREKFKYKNDSGKAEKDPYDCDELAAKAKERHAKAKAAAKARAEAPKKTEVTKAKDKIEKTHEAIHKQVDAGKFGKAQLQKLITETEELLTFLKKAFKSL